MTEQASIAVWFVYIIQTTTGILYTGIATDVERRFTEHCATYHGQPKSLVKKGAKFFRGHQPERVVYKEAVNSRSEATKRELAIKKMSRAAKLKLLDDTLADSA